MLNILVVDDSFVMRRNIITVLKRLGHEMIVEAKNGREAIDTYATHSPHLVTMDITMPGMDGITAVKEIKKINPDAKIIMVTSHSQKATVIEAIKAGASGYVLKPVNKDQLDNAIKKIYPSTKHIPKINKDVSLQSDEPKMMHLIEDDFNIELFDFEAELTRIQ